MIRQWLIDIAIALGLLAGRCEFALAGMPAVLPTNWTKDTAPPDWAHARTADPASKAVYLQAISFFLVLLLGSAWAVKGLWNFLRKDFAALPQLTYFRSLSLVVLWGLLFVVVLTMISGARELMTPGAWRKQGWTYKLTDAPPADHDSRAERKQALEQLRLELWKYAATHEGNCPSHDDPAIGPEFWEIPGWRGLRFECVSGRKASDAGQLLVYEPEIDGDERQVLLTNGLIGTMRTSEIKQALATAREP